MILESDIYCMYDKCVCLKNDSSIVLAFMEISRVLVPLSLLVQKDAPSAERVQPRSLKNKCLT